MLRITRQSDYGIVLMTLFSKGDGSAVLSARDMAADTNLPLPTVSKILKALTRAGLLESTRGVHGGYAATRPTSEISLVDVIEAIEGPIALTDCVSPENRDCAIKETCACKDNWQRVNIAIRNALGTISLTDMTPGCRFEESEANVPDRSGIEDNTGSQHELA